MKRLTIFAIISLIIFSVSIQGANAFQKTILLNKSCQSIPGLTMKQVTITEDKTLVNFEWENAEGNWAISIYAPENDSAFVIKDKRTERTYRLRSAEGIAYYPNKLNIKEGDVKRFTLVFDKIPYPYLNVLEEAAELIVSAVYQ
jgi:hypothetical protein